MSKGNRGDRYGLRPSHASAVRSVGPLTVGEGADSLRIDVAKLPAPAVQFDADFAWPEINHGTVSLFFAKLSRDVEDRLSSRFELRMAGEDVSRMVNGSRDFFVTIKERRTGWTEALRTRPNYPRKLAADRSHSEWASYLYVAYSGSRGVIDAYELSVPGLARYLHTNNPAGLILRAVARIQMSAFDLCELLIELERVMPALEAELLESKLLSSKDLGIDSLDAKASNS